MLQQQREVGKLGAAWHALDQKVATNDRPAATRFRGGHDVFPFAAWKPQPLLGGHKDGWPVCRARFRTVSLHASSILIKPYILPLGVLPLGVLPCHCISLYI